MNTQKPYLTQYCELMQEWKKGTYKIDAVTEEYTKQVRDLREETLKQSGLTFEEFYLISTCRQYSIFNKVHEYMLYLLKQ